MEPKRRLPVIRTPEQGEAAPLRPPWQWVGFGALATVVVWLPLAGLLARLLGGAATLLDVIAHLGALAVASWAGGFIVGRWGTERIGLREAVLGPMTAVTCAVAWSLVRSGGGVFGAIEEILAMAIAALPSAAMGGARGLRRRRAT
jgi:hypothetical protein